MKWVKLGDIIPITSGGTPLTSRREYYDNGTIPWVKTGDLKGQYILDTPDRITSLGLENSSAKIFPANTVLIAMYGATIGNCSILKIEAATNQACAALLPSEHVNEEYLYFYLRTIKQKLIAQGVGGGQPNISGAILKHTNFPLIPLENQILIANILSKAESLINQRKESLRLLDEFLKSTFLEMFGDPVRDSRFNKVPLESLIDQKRGISYGIVQRGDSKESGIPVVRIRDVEAASYEVEDFVKTLKSISDKYKRTILEGGEILISIRGTVGKLSIAPAHTKGWNISREVAIIPVVADLDKLFLLFLLRSHPIQQKILGDVKGVAQSGINLSDLRLLPVIIPPKKLQTEFAQIAKKAEAIRSKYRTSLQELENLYGSLSQRTFKPSA